jgi:probable F420-dependent oxidoreductase
VVDVGVQLWPQHTSYAELRSAWSRAEDLGVASIWSWDHFFPITEPSDGAHLEGWTLLTAAAALTTTPLLGVLVTSASYRNPQLLADVARTADHVSGGRVVLAVGAGWSQRDHEEYGYELGSPRERLARLEETVRAMRHRLPRLDPPPIGDLPLLIGGGGEEVTLRIVAQHADWWNTFGPPEDWARKNRVLDGWCERVGRDPTEIVRTALAQTASDLARAEEFIEAGATHLIIGRAHPYDLDPVADIIDRVSG